MVKEKYLTIEILSKTLRVYAFKNKARELNKQAPHYKGSGIAVWINEREETPQPEAKQEEEVVL